MKKYFIVILILFIVTSVSSCSKDWLDEKPDKTATVPEKLADFQGLMDYLVGMNQQFPSIGQIASDGHYVTDQVYQSALKGFATDGFIWSKTMAYKNISDWNLAYSKILIDNIVIEGVDKYIVENEDKKQDWYNVKGQALFNRAKNLFELAQIFAPPYDSITAKVDLGVVLRLSSDITLPSKRSSVQSTYEQIIIDLKAAIEVLPNNQTILTRGSRTAAFALLSRVYLSIGDYKNSFDFADSCLKMNSNLLDYNILPTANFIGRYNKEVLYHSNFTLNFLSSNGLIEQSYFNLYQATDVRRVKCFRQNANGTISFRGNYESVTNNFFGGLATDEVYLTRAECYARMNKKSEALKDLNDLLKNRFETGKFVPLEASSADEALKLIITERRKELIFRGIRWMDLRRLNRDPRFATTLKRTVLGKEYILEPLSYKYTFPIPDDIIQQTGIPQNPGWEK